MATITERRAALTARLAEIDARLDRIEEELDVPAEPDWEDAAIVHEGDQALESLGAASLREAEMIRAALSRMDRGEYGYCVKCGEAISDERLDVLPATPFCRNCAT